jgi:NDP-sugar pyrophosphorylase family protein
VEYVQVRATPAQQLKQLADSGRLSDPFLLHYCDIRLHKVDWPWVFSSYARNRDSARGSFVGMVLASRWLKLGVGIVRPLNDDFVGEFVEHPERPLSTDLIGTGVALFETRFIDYIRPEDGSVFADVVPRAIKREKAKLAYCPLPSWDHIQHMDDLFDCQVGYYPHMAGRPAAMSRTIRPEERGARKAG